MGLIIRWLSKSLIIFMTAYLLPGFRVGSFGGAMVLAIILGLLNVLVKPLLSLVTLPINILSLGLFSWVINALVLGMAVAIVPGVSADSWGIIFMASVLISLLSMIMDRVGR